MEDMSTVFMYIDAFYLLTVDIASELWSLVDDETALSCLLGSIGERCPEEAGADNEIVVFHEKLYLKDVFDVWRVHNYEAKGNIDGECQDKHYKVLTKRIQRTHKRHM